MSLKSETVIDYLKRFPKTSKHTLAEKIAKENPLLFKDKEDARGIIRYQTGSFGKRARKRVANKIEHETEFSSQNPYGLPPSEAIEPTPYILPVANNNILFLTDVHVPYHNISAISLAMKYGIDRSVNTIYLNGDCMDFYKASFHEQDPRNRDLKYEYQAMRDFLDSLERAFPNAKIFWKEGNHCMRWERYLRVKAPMILDMEEFRISVIMKLRERGIEWIPNSQLVKMGKLNALHGNEYKGGGGINVARTLWLRAGDNVIAGDKHKTQSGLKTIVGGKVMGTWSVGCLCELNPNYLPFNEWNLGFARIEIERSGDFFVENMSIINNKIM